MKRFRGVSTLVLLLVLGVALSSCTSAAKKKDSTASSSPGSTPKKGGTVTISNEQGQTWTCQFNPFNPAVNLESLGFVYEPLVFVNLLSNQAETPMLASSYTWGPGKDVDRVHDSTGREMERRPAVHAPTTSCSPSTS